MDWTKLALKGFLKGSDFPLKMHPNFHVPLCHLWHDGFMSKKALVFGAGKIGRGFLDQLLSQSDFEIVFVDIDEGLVSLLNQRGGYPLKLIGDEERALTVSGVRAVRATDEDEVLEEIATADLLLTAAGARALSSLSRLIARGLRKRWEQGVEVPLNILICENLPQPARTMQELVGQEMGTGYQDQLEQKVGFVETVICRMVPDPSREMRSSDPLLIMAEDYSILPVDKKGFRGKIPRMTGMMPVDSFVGYVHRKLYTYNTCHAVVAYLGYLKGYAYIYEAIADETILKVVRGALEESGQAVIQKYSFDQVEQREYGKDFIRRIRRKELADTVHRVAKDPLRKLAPEERLLGPATLAWGFGITPHYLSLGIAAALRYDYPQDEASRTLSRMLEEEGLDQVLREVCQLDPQSVLSQLIKEKLAALPDLIKE
ncbi:mannitol-1-phosphate 5-dehydrogenase [Candidatus Hakubella thermalkaliphila]|uniref:Mannitol-1-phosphate 5-dehydrogenase n=1 Tax=Candidatus Hakubella thermalkaliphila TaxID=2754717 RepID=A0A6V8NVA7_9ACTN|nr:mannitol-1-phosphate 5-dehydrogenase [Candidatus Hakubella thermalkaliphila]